MIHYQKLVFPSSTYVLSSLVIVVLVYRTSEILGILQTIILRSTKTKIERIADFSSYDYRYTKVSTPCTYSYVRTVEIECKMF